MIDKLNKYMNSFDYIDKIFIVLSTSFGTLNVQVILVYCIKIN